MPLFNLRTILNSSIYKLQSGKILFLRPGITLPAGEKLLQTIINNSQIPVVNTHIINFLLKKLWHVFFIGWTKNLT